MAVEPIVNQHSQRALRYLQVSDEQTLADQIALCEIEAPTFEEQERGAFFAQRLRDYGLSQVQRDAVGNVIGHVSAVVIPPALEMADGAQQEENKPPIVFCAHLDSVFPRGTLPKVQRDGAILRAPGIQDNARGVAVLLALARALQQMRLRPRNPLWLVGSVGEEGAGDLRGVRHLFSTRFANQRPHAFVAVDGCKLDELSCTALGVLRYRITYTGPGGHSYTKFGIPNPVHAVGRAISKISAIHAPTTPRSTYNVNRIGGGTSINAIPQEAWLEIDLRSESPPALATLDTQFHSAIAAALQEEQARQSGRPLSMQTTLIGQRPAGGVPPNTPLVRTAIEVANALGWHPHLGGPVSCDYNIPLSLGVPSVLVGGGGQADAAHSLQEWFDSTASYRGPQYIFALMAALVGLEEQI